MRQDSSGRHARGMDTFKPETTVRGLDTDRAAVFLLHCEWPAGTGTSLHQHAGWELVLVVGGRLRYLFDGDSGVAGEGCYLRLPAHSVHAIWADEKVTFDVIGQEGLGLMIVVPDGDGTRSVPVYAPTGPWAQEPPPGVPYTASAELEQLRRASQSLLRRRGTQRDATRSGHVR